MMKNLGLKVLLATVALVTAACSPVTSINGEPESSAETTSPLEPYFAAVWGTGLDQEEQIRRAEQRTIREEELIAQCMRKAGFEYIPFPEGTTFRFGDPELWRPDDREWVAQNGYGMFSDATPPDSMITAGRFAGNPNWDQNPAINPHSTMTEAEWELYLETLQGPFIDFEDDFFVVRETGEQIPRGELSDFLANNSCQGQARAELNANSAFALTESDEFAPLFASILDLRQTLNDAITEADREWSVCMADGGYPELANQRAAEALVQRRSTAFWDDWTWENRGHPDRDPEMIAIRELEIELALADFDCRAATDFDARQAAHRFELETQFVNDHRTALEALRAAAEQLS